jgi:hypothetical protein
MKKYRLFIVVISIMIFTGFTGCNSKSGTWTQEDKNTWTTNCMTFMNQQGVEQKAAADFCDCMLQKTSQKYTPQEAANITTEEERSLWNECNYSW